MSGSSSTVIIEDESLTSGSSDLRDLAQILRLMLIAENENTFRDVDVETLEQMIVMNEKDLIASFEMVSGVRPSNSRVNIQQITNDYYDKKKKQVPVLNIVSDDIDPNIVPSNNNNTDDDNHVTNNNIVISDEKPIEILFEEDNLVLQQNDPPSSTPVIPLHVQLKLRVLKMKLKDVNMDNRLSDNELAKALIEHDNEVQTAFESIMENNKKVRFSDDFDREQISIQEEEDPEDSLRYSKVLINSLRTKMRIFGLTEYATGDDEAICALLDIGEGDIDCTLNHLNGSLYDPPKKASSYVSDPDLPWDKNPKKPITNEAKEALQKEGRSFVCVNQLPYDSLEHIFEYLGRKDVLVSSSVNQYFNKVASADFFWTNMQEKGKAGLIDNHEMERYRTFTKNQTHYGSWKLWRLDNLFYTKIKNTPQVISHKNEESTEESPIVELEDGRVPFKHKYAQYRKQKLIRERVDIIEKKIEDERTNNYHNMGNDFNDHMERSWIGFFIVLAISVIIGLILVPLSMDEFIPNEIGTYYWLISWLSLGIVSIPYFYIMLFHHSHHYEFYPIWSKRQLSGKSKMDHGAEMLILFSSTWTWVPYMFLVAGLKYAVFPDSPILSYIAIPGYALAIMSFFCGAPTLGSTLQGNHKERVAFFVSSFFYGTMLLSLQVFLILLFAKMDGLEYALNIPFSIIFIPGYVTLLCFPIGFFVTAFIAMVMGSDSCWSACMTSTGFSFLVSLFISPLVLTAPFVAAVLDSFILQTVFPFVAIFSITYGLGIIILGITLCIFCFLMCVSRDYD